MDPDLLKQYLRQCQNCICIADEVKKACPEMADYIDRQEEVYFVSYYSELPMDARLDQDTARQIIEAYTRNGNPWLGRLAGWMRSDYGVE